MNVTYKRNLDVIKRRFASIYHSIQKNTQDTIKEYEVVETKVGLSTLRVTINGKTLYLHSKYDPLHEAKRYIDDHFSDEINSYIVYGLGFGYHLKELIKRNPSLELTIIETNRNVLIEALKNVDLNILFEKNNVKLIFKETRLELHKELTRINFKNSIMILHYPSVQLIPNDLIEIKHLLEEYRVKVNSIKRFKSTLDENFDLNINHFDEAVNVLFGKFENKALVIVSAGPSLDKNKHLLKELKNKAIILSVGTALRPLLNVGVIPDYIIMTDPQDLVYNQIAGINIRKPLIALSTCNKQVLQYYQGKKYLAFQEGYIKAEEYAKKNNIETVKTGGSVATTALDIAIKFKANPIIFVGQDLAFTNSKSHADETDLIKDIIHSKNLRMIKGIDGKSVNTSKTLSIYLRWIENRIKQEPNIAFVDATEGGAKIKGTKIMELKEVFSHLKGL
ncbi:6-hydroxymethylpterin diphosphokinase MptE-like protein [Alkalihalobacillus sp. BA299]|uniref:motility associated factor glycosyltransferase family protein n=1 Tax=Alkalihalobacillus sp. BA299 TaxID=2815938 RepID=UPI001ADD3D3B|nr:6-hydroxymethylpterin diphosphokinase MptE-like protein [Alkalihalobacillus sp. BA299]